MIVLQTLKVHHIGILIINMDMCIKNSIKSKWVWKKVKKASQGVNDVSIET